MNEGRERERKENKEVVKRKEQPRGHEQGEEVMEKKRNVMK